MNKDDLPDIIYLIDSGDHVEWCDDPDPDGNHDPQEAVKYVKAEMLAEES